MREAAIVEIYASLNRISKAEKLRNNIILLEKMLMLYGTPICRKLLEKLIAGIENGKSLKEYITLEGLDTTEQLIQAIFHIENNTKECYIREFSIRYFSDSKILEGLFGKVTKVMHEFEPRFEGMDVYEILAEYFVYHTPNFVYFKGNAILEFENTRIELKQFQDGIGIPGDALPALRTKGTEGVTKVITIENLTTFFRWKESGSIIIYLGGYHNSVRRELLKVIVRQIPQAEYLHFGDIDVGGSEIYEDLCKKTGIPFKIYRMDIDTLKEYQRYTKELTEHDRKRILSLREKIKTDSYTDVLDYMLEYNIKLEQECIGMANVALPCQGS